MCDCLTCSCAVKEHVHALYIILWDGLGLFGVICEAHSQLRYGPVMVRCTQA